MKSIYISAVLLGSIFFHISCVQKKSVAADPKPKTKKSKIVVAKDADAEEEEGSEEEGASDEEEAVDDEPLPEDTETEAEGDEEDKPSDITPAPGITPAPASTPSSMPKPAPGTSPATPSPGATPALPAPGATPAQGMTPATTPAVMITYADIAEKVIKPYCLRCHTVGAAKGNVDLSTFLKVKPRAIELKHVSIDEAMMPPASATKLPEDMKKLLGDWIAAGAPEK